MICPGAPIYAHGTSQAFYRVAGVSQTPVDALAFAASSPPLHLATASFAADFQSSGPNVLRLGPNQVVLSVLFDHVRAPPGDPAAREGGHERTGVETDRLEHQRRKKLHVGSQVAAR